MLSRRILVILAALTALTAYFALFEDIRTLYLPAGILFGLLVMTWIFQHQINWWYYKRNPPALPDAVRKLFLDNQQWYAGLDPEAQKRFDERCTLYVIGKEWIAQGPENIPEDLKYIAAFYATMVTWNKDDHLIEGFDRIVFYLHPFLSPHYREQVHTYEVEQVDGTILFAVDHLTAGFTGKGKYYQTGLHAMAEALQAKMSAEYPGGHVWTTLEQIGGFSRTKLEEITGMNQENTWPVAVHHFFTYNKKFRDLSPELYGMIASLLGFPGDKAL